AATTPAASPPANRSSWAPFRRTDTGESSARKPELTPAIFPLRQVGTELFRNRTIAAQRVAMVQHSSVSLRLLRAARLIRCTALGYRRFTVLFAHWARRSLGGCRTMTSCAGPAHLPK